MNQTCAPPSGNEEAHQLQLAGPGYQVTQTDYPTAKDEKLATGAPPESFRKRFSRLQAKFAMAGYEFHELQAGSLIVMRWGMRKVLADLGAAQKMLDEIGGHHG